MSTTRPAPRLPDWPSRLQALMQQRGRAPFAWGFNDCFLFAADCARACTGVDPAADLRGRYATEREALRILQQIGGTLAALAETRFGAEIAPAFAQRGDVGLTEQAGRALLCVNAGARWVAPSPEGLAEAPAPTRAWRIAPPCPR